ncbi:MAG: carboxylate-amine ligase [Gammaproteobacteria bacterium]|nr:carboxylate-amine ligase [Gammaproteobacteria bacterium]MCY4218134.1 carboxylate-amine ligase [Gammaproteobacteria bacterium]MCY4275241.1 carboxylate-amine ligase [Gammaproteobacteria bacterium]
MNIIRNQDQFPITLGVEEELFLVDPETRDLVVDPNPDFFNDCENVGGPHQYVHELFRSQIESNSCVCYSMDEVRQFLIDSRNTLLEIADKYGATIMAASTHPTGSWQSQITTAMERYERFTETYQASVRRFFISGMHIHAGFGDRDIRIKVMTALRRYLPFLHALSTSSPFAAGNETGFKSYRLTLIGGLPRTGIPNPLYSHAEYDELLQSYRDMKFVSDGSELWWDIRPSHKFPTIEMRICDVCTRIEDAMSIVSLYACLIRWLMRTEQNSEFMPEPLTEFIMENRWIAQRYGVVSFFGDQREESGRIDIYDYTKALQDLLIDDAHALNCVEELYRCTKIISEGTGADRQIDRYRMEKLNGRTHSEALAEVIKMILDDTKSGLGYQ